MSNNSKIEEFTYNVFIDLDKTLLSVDSGTVLAMKAHKKGMMRTRDLLNGLYLSILYKLELRDTRKIINAMAMWMKGIKESDFDDFAKSIVEDHLLHQVRPELRKAIQKHKKAGAKIVMLSASLNYICEPIAEACGFDHTLCSHLIVDEGMFTGKPKGILCFGKEKLRRLDEYYQSYPGKSSDDYYYADSFSDVFVMRKVGHPVAVDPDRHLRRYSKRHNWKIIR